MKFVRKITVIVMFCKIKKKYGAPSLWIFFLIIWFDFFVGFDFFLSQQKISGELYNFFLEYKFLSEKPVQKIEHFLNIFYFISRINKFRKSFGSDKLQYLARSVSRFIQCQGYPRFRPNFLTKYFDFWQKI